MKDKKTVAVLFGGKSPEHDVSILTGLQVIESIDSTAFDIIPVYIDQKGKWWTGKDLLDRKNYHFSDNTKKQLQQIQLNLGEDFTSQPFFSSVKKSMLSKTKKFAFDIAFFAFHGSAGESGQLQGVFETVGIPYTGPRVSSASIWMDKSISKRLFKEAGIKVLPELILKKEEKNNLETIKKLFKKEKLSFPVCAKPCNLGSSICVFKATDMTELYSAILEILKVDTEVMIEPFVKNLIEYNVAVTKSLTGKIEVSAIESPIKNDDCLSFKDKYLSEGGIDNKLSVSLSEGMASASRDLNPKLTKEQKTFIVESAEKAFVATRGTGAPRIDFLCNNKSKEVWLNEINPIPGSLGYYLWEAKKVGFTNLLTALIYEALSEKKKLDENTLDLKSFNASIFP